MLQSLGKNKSRLPSPAQGPLRTKPFLTLRRQNTTLASVVRPNFIGDVTLSG